jgi:predicted negative regulator of RcsB-dependent stress response
MAEEYLTDDEQFEAIKRWLAENGVWVVAGVALGAALLFGYRFYENRQNERALRASAQFGTLTDAIEKNDRAGAHRIAESIVEKYSGSPYADQADLALGRLFVDEGQPDKAIGPLLQVATGSKDKELRNIARLRIARLQIDLGKPDEAIATLASVASTAFGARAHEVRGDALLAKKDPAGAANEYRAAMAATDPREGDVSELELKIADLGVPATPVAVTTVPPSAAPARVAGAGKP